MRHFLVGARQRLTARPTPMAASLRFFWHMTCSKWAVAVKATNPSKESFPKVATIDQNDLLQFRGRSHSSRPGHGMGRSEIDNDTEVLMARFKFRRTLRFDNLEGRQLLSSSAGAGPPTSSNTCSS